MATYLVIHTPRADDEAGDPAPPTRLTELALEHGREGACPRWLRTWSSDLHDERIFSMWEATSAEEIRITIERFGFLDTMDAHPVNVHEWGPADVLEAESNQPE